MLQSLTVAILGLYVGAMLTEGLVLVPYWRSLEADQFFSWYAANDARLFGFFGAVTALAMLVTMAAALVSLRARLPGRRHALLAAGLMLIALLMFPLYFAGANASFAAATISAADLPGELARWATWHWIRTVLSGAALAAFVLAPRASPVPT